MLQSSGRLVLCPTPLGNLEDITLRTLRELRGCDVIFAEDTRVARKLLSHFAIAKPVESFHERVETQRIRRLRALLAAGQTVAVVSDAGMPGISDPGAELVRAARSAGAVVDALPGPNAALGALALSGFDVARFRFDGFPPRQRGERRAYLRSLDAELHPVALYEAPSRVVGLLEDAAALLPERRLFVLREYTKLFEQQILGTAVFALAQLARPPRGEFCVVVEGARRQDRSKEIPAAVYDAIAALLEAGTSVRATADALRLATGLPKNALYKLAQSLKEQAPSRPRGTSHA